MMALVLLLYLLHNLTEATLMMRGAPFASLALLLCFASGRASGLDRSPSHGR
jgi:hypothetical protein